MKRVAWRRADEGVAASIGTMLAVLVMLALLTMFTTSWAPEWTKSKEAEHMRLVESQMSNLKALVDSLSLSGNTNAVVSSPITLGSAGVPLFSSDATGTVSLKSSYGSTFNTFNVTNSTGTYERVAYGSIVYQSHNTEFLDQEFLYESGAIIVSQGSSYVVSIGPAVIIQNVSGRLDLAFTLVSVYSDGTEYTSDGTVGVQCRLVSEKIATTTTWSIPETVYVNITSPAYDAWYHFFERLIPKNNVGIGDYDISVDTVREMVCVEFRNVASVTTDYVIVGANLDLS